MGKSCCDKDCEHEENHLYNAWMKHTRHIPRLHAQHCHDKCGCYDPKYCKLLYMSYNTSYNLNIKNQFLIPSN